MRPVMAKPRPAGSFLKPMMPNTSPMSGQRNVQKKNTETRPRIIDVRLRPLGGVAA